jgi:hypothetical protein
MSADDLYLLDEGSQVEIQEALAELKRRCVSIIQNVFSRPIDIQRDFSTWFDEWVKFSGDVVVVLHDEPLYIIARYLRLDPGGISPQILDAVEKLATREHWD